MCHFNTDLCNYAFHISDIKTIRWGVKKKGRFTGKIPDESFRRNNRLLPVNFAKYDNMETYIEDNIRIALLKLFEVGFTLKGYKVKKR